MMMLYVFLAMKYKSYSFVTNKKQENTIVIQVSQDGSREHLEGTLTNMKEVALRSHHSVDATQWRTNPKLYGEFKL